MREQWVSRARGVRVAEQEARVMFAAVGDRLIVHGHHVGEPDRDAEILEVRHQDGSPPYLVRWSDSGQEGLVFPGPDAFVQNFARGNTDA